MGIKFIVKKDHVIADKYIRENDETVVKIPDTYGDLPVTAIGMHFLRKDQQVKQVLLPEKLQTIGNGAFFACRELEYVGVGAPTRYLKQSCILPRTVQIIGARAFACTGIVYMHILSRQIELGNRAFADNEYLKCVSMVTCAELKLGEAVFAGSALEDFYGRGIKIDMLPKRTFANCRYLERVELGFRAVAERAFYGCGMLAFLSSLGPYVFVGEDAFKDCALQPRTESGEETMEETLENLALIEELCTGKEGDEEREIHYEEPPVNDRVNAHVAATKPLFSMPIVYLCPRWKHAPNFMFGRFEKALGDHVTFCENENVVINKVRLRSELPEEDAVLQPLLESLTSQENVWIVGRQEKDQYLIHDILPGSWETGEPIPETIYAQVCDRLRKAVPADLQTGGKLSCFALKKPKEFEIFVRACRDKLPQWVVRAYAKNMEIAVGEKQGKSDAIRHATEALKLLLNIDWLPYELHLPSAREVQRQLDSAFYGLEPVKRRILEVVAQIRRSGTLPKWGILLNGPAGTGKTSIAKVVAKLLDMPLIQMDMSSLGKDPDEISGSSRIYSNASPGMLVRSMYANRTSTAVLLANEVDKADRNGGHVVSDILLTILDKTGLYENFLEEIIPTDNLLCIGTCNDLSKISKPLRDRFLIIDIPGYTPQEKREIWKGYVLPKAMQKASVLQSEMGFTEEALDKIIREYAIEPGARDLEQLAERFIGDFCRVADAAPLDEPYLYTPVRVRELLGPGRQTMRCVAAQPGQVRGAYYYEGKANFFVIEAAVLPGTGELEIIGPMSESQKEFCKAAYWCVRSTLGRDLRKVDVTVFVSEPVPGDGDNYVGFACYAAICSRLLDISIPLRENCFLGGMDIHGALYFDESDLTPLLRAMKIAGVTTLYAPMGTTSLVDSKENSDCRVAIVEALDAPTLFSLAATQTRKK